MRIGAVIIVVWLLIGVFAAYQRGYFGQTNDTCATAGTTLLAVAAGPLNYVGLNPKAECTVPQPSP